MKRRMILLATVIVAVGFILGFKTHTTTAVGTRIEEANPNSALATTVLLFADPREAGQSCGCAEVVRLVRAVGDRPGVLVREIDSRKPGDDARYYEVRVSPSVVIVDPSDRVVARFEGESLATIEALKSRLGVLFPAANGNPGQ